MADTKDIDAPISEPEDVSPEPADAVAALDDSPQTAEATATQIDQTNDTESKPPLVVIMHASVGSGHKSAANAIAEAFTNLGTLIDIPDNLQVEVLDVLDFGRIRFDGNKTASMFTGATRPIYDLTWRYTLTGRLLWGGGTGWSRVMFPKFNEYVRDKQPIAVICTHITAANVAVGARMITGCSYPVVCVPTDYEVEGWWPHLETDLFCVANESMAETLRPRKVKESHIKLTGIPVRTGFTTEYDRDEQIGRFGLPKDKVNVLVMAGASLPQPYVRMRQELDKTLPFLRSLETMNFVFLPGKDKEYSDRLKGIFQGMGLDNAMVLDYVEDMPALMNAADLAILKSGGLSVTECLCAKLPMLLLGKSYGQEKANTQMLTSMGASMHATTARELIATLRYIDAHPESLKALLINGASLRRPDAANDIAIATMDLTKQTREVRRYFANFYIGGKPAHIR